jgi:hypothetical protein
MTKRELHLPVRRDVVIGIQCHGPSALDSDLTIKARGRGDTSDVMRFRDGAVRIHP